MSASQELTLVLVGDVSVNRDDPPSVFRYVNDLLRDADFTIGNLEAATADVGTPWSKWEGSPAWKTDSRQIQAIASAKFDAVNIANNHILDYGFDALFETIGHLDRLGIGHAGGGRNFAEAHAPAIIERGGCKLALLAYTSVFAHGWAAGPESPGLAVMRVKSAYEPHHRAFEEPGSPQTIRTWMVPEDKVQLGIDIEAARKLADIVVCSFHWGVSAGFVKLTDYQVELGHHAIDMGADLVFGHHPHVVQGIDVYRGRPIFYSVGNFTFAKHVSKKGHELETVIVRCVIRDRKIKTVEILPAICDDDLNPRVLDQQDGKYIVDLIKRRSLAFDTQFIQEGDVVGIPILE